MRAAATFTVRDLSRRTAELLAAVRKFGAVEISARTGEVFTIATKKPKKKAPTQKQLWEEFVKKNEERAQRFRELGYLPPKPGEWDQERFNRIIAGEE
jgi:antitoxin (DNA-binding transcriptional repressor) of toxin-antitoxin stability system